MVAIDAVGVELIIRHQVDHLGSQLLWLLLAEKLDALGTWLGFLDRRRRIGISHLRYFGLLDDLRLLLTVKVKLYVSELVGDFSHFCLAVISRQICK